MRHVEGSGVRKCPQGGGADWGAENGKGNCAKGQKAGQKSCPSLWLSWGGHRGEGGGCGALLWASRAHARTTGRWLGDAGPVGRLKGWKHRKSARHRTREGRAGGAGCSRALAWAGCLVRTQSLCVHCGLACYFRGLSKAREVCDRGATREP
eukprot:6187655-Prymnesium_polylepis.1